MGSWTKTWITIGLALVVGVACAGPADPEAEAPCAAVPSAEMLAVLSSLGPRIDPTGGDAGRGGALFAEHCTRCHSTRVGERDSRFFADYPRLDCPAYLDAISDDYLTAVIQYGSEPFGKNAVMVAWGEQLSDAEIADLLAHLRAP